MNKYNFPLDFSVILEKWFVKNKDEIILQKKENIFTFKDKIEDSQYFFRIPKVDLNKTNQIIINIKFYPLDRNNIVEKEKNILLNTLEEYLNGWLETIQSFRRHFNLFDDPLLTAYANEYFEEYKILDDDAEINPFNLQQQELLTEFFGNLPEQILPFENEANKVEIEEIVNESKQLKESITKLSKNETMRRISKIFAKLRKQGLPLFKFFLEEIAKYGIKKLMDGIV